MRTLLCIALSGFQLMLPAGLEAKPAFKAASSTANEQTAAQLLEFLGGGKDDGNNWRLSRHWVGTMKTLAASGHYKDDTDFKKDEPVRFHVFTGRSWSGGRIANLPALMAMGKYHSTWWTTYRRDLPTIADLQNKEKLPGILKSFGESQSTDSWGGVEGEMHWMESWLCFTPLDNGRLRVLDIAAFFVEPKGKPKKLDALSVREGFFRPSDPADPKDVRDFPSEEENEAKRQAEIDAKDDEYPEPLRSYLKANHAPGGSDRMDIWFAAIRKFRANPDGALLKQIVARLDETESTGVMSIEIPTVFETLFHDSTYEKKIGGWNAEKRRQAQALLLDALPEANNRESLEMAVNLALRETKVGPLKTDIDALNVKPSRFEIPAVIPRSALDLKSCSVRRAGEILRDEILARWKKRK